MRNHLAEEVLDADMCNLMKHYKMSLKNGSILDSTIELLEHSSNLIKIFRDHRPILSVNDIRLKSLKEDLIWFRSWREEVYNLKISQKEKEKRLPGKKCLDDIDSLISTFVQICRIHTTDFPGQGVSPSRFNSDIIENNFCQVRGLHNGNTTNPNYNTYKSTMNSVILGQSCKSRGRKSNAGIPTADPYSFDIDIPKKQKRQPLQDITNK